MSNKLNGLTPRQAKLLLMGLARLFPDRQASDQEDIAYLRQQLRPIAGRES